MPLRVCNGFRWIGLRVAAMLIAFATPASAQSVSLPAWDVTLRAGIYEDVNFGNQGFLETKSSTNPDKVRRALLKFDTHRTIPAGSRIDSATLTLTVRSGSVRSRHLAVYCVPSSFDELQATWHLRKGTLNWGAPGGDVGHQHGVVAVTNVAGSKVIIDVTAIAREAMQRPSRYTRVLLVDIDGTTGASYMAYYSNEASPALRPNLVVNYRVGATTAPDPPDPPDRPDPPKPHDPPKPPDPPKSRNPNAKTLRVLQWNIQQGWTSNGKPNLDLVVDWVIKMDPDVISFNEIIHYASPAADHIKIIADKLKARTGETWSYNWIQKSGAKGGEGEAVMSRLPFESTATNLLPHNRSAAEAMVMVNGRAVNVISTHLDYNASWSSTRRLAQIKELKPWAETFAEQRIIMGDFNAWPQLREIHEMKEEYRDAWAEAEKTNDDVGYPGNSEGNTRKNRLDYVFYSKDAHALVVKKAQVYDTRDARGNKPSDHNPLVVTFEVR
jgi:endonuclease/exonuclease/phosphatase family metal-dependent hydrolase